jgi:hypothetical protein
MLRRNHLVGILCLVLSSATFAQQSGTRATNHALLHTSLTAPGSPSFHLKATIADRDNQDSGEIEIYWVNPTKWRRTINSTQFSQTSIVNGTRVFEQDSDDYFPLSLHLVLTAMTDPQSLLDAFAPAELATRASGTKPPPVCEHLRSGGSMSMEMLCRQGPFREMETIGAPSDQISFADYQDFKGRKIARLLIRSRQVTRVTELTELQRPDDKLFSIDEPTPPGKCLRVVTLQEPELRSQAMQPLEIIWPQVLDGATTGSSSYYLSIDRNGEVRELAIAQSTNERANESALRQIEKWKFRPLIKDGVPVQVEGALTFATDTRAWGPANPLTDAEARKLASNVSDPIFPPGTAPGALCTVRIAIDDEGNLIEAIAGEGTPGLFGPCYHAVKMWQFHPILQDGQPRPYRAELVFHAP